MTTIRRRPGERFEGMWRRFSKGVTKAGTLTTARRSQFFLSPSQRRKMKRRIAAKKRRKAEEPR